MQLDLFADNIVIENSGELVVSSITISENIDLMHDSIISNILKFENELKEFGTLREQDFKEALNISNNKSLLKQRRAFLLNENQTMLLINLSRNSELVVRFKVSLTKAFSVMKQKLYQKTLSLPQTYLEALRALTLEVENRQQLEKKVNLLTHASKLYTTSEIAKEIGLKSANALNSILNDDGVQYKQNGTWLMYSKYSERGYVSIKQQVLDSGKIIYDRKWTGIGRDFILNKYSSEVKNEKII